MRLILPLILILSSLCQAQDLQNYGKSEAQILAMGGEKWAEFYLSQAGNSTHDMVDAAEIYGTAAKHRTDRILDSKPKSKGAILKLRSLLNDFDKSAIDVSFAESGGGTMYNPMWASVSGEVEDTLYSLLTGKGAKAPGRVVSQVKAKIDKVAAKLEKMHRDPESKDYLKYPEAKASIASMRKDFDQVVLIAKTMSRKDSNRLLDFCFTRSQNALG